MSESTTNHPQLNIDEILQSVRESVRKASNEAELKMGVSKVIEDKILKPLAITQVGKYEYTLVSGARLDALYGNVIVEYKAPSGNRNLNEVLCLFLSYLFLQCKK